MNKFYKFSLLLPTNSSYISTTEPIYSKIDLLCILLQSVPEIGEELPEKNPLHHRDGLPKFNQITIENCRAAIAKQTLDLEMEVAAVENQLKQNECKDVFTDIIEPLETLGNLMETTWGMSKTLYLGNNTLMPAATYMAIHERARRARTTKFNSKKIYSAIKEELSNNKSRSSEENRVLKKYALEGKLNGLELDQKRKSTVMYNLSKLAQERHDFKFKNDVATRQHAQIVSDRTIVRDFPDDLLKVHFIYFYFILLYISPFRRLL